MHRVVSGETAITGWKKEKPLLIRDRSGNCRLATREERHEFWIQNSARHRIGLLFWPFPPRTGGNQSRLLHPALLQMVGGDKLIIPFC